MADSAVSIIIHGKVQGVSFRLSAQAKALDLCLAGWVRNLSNGTVEVYAEGNRKSLDCFIKWCQQGPPSAKVLRCNLDWLSPEEMSDFRIL